MQNSTTVRRRRSPAQREKILSAYRRSELSQRAFAARAGIGLSTLGLWLRQAKLTAAAATGFVEVPNPLAPPKAAAVYRLHLGGGVIVEVSSGFQSEEVAALVQLFPAR
jgi:transposase-like protein